MTSKVERLCAFAGCDNVGVHLCSGCGEEIYCSKECQKAHWATHKPLCSKATNTSKLRNFDSLSAKQLKNALKAKAAGFDDSKRKSVLDQLEKLVEKPELVHFVSKYVKPSEIDKLLSSPAVEAAKEKKEEKKKTKEALKNLFPTPTPEQLKEQSAMMRNNPNLVRQANPAFAKMSDEQIRQYADYLEKVCISLI